MDVNKGVGWACFLLALMVALMTVLFGD